MCGLLAQGATVAVVTDAGLPGVSDPGERLVAAVVDAGHDVTVIPGPSAGLAALVVSGLPTARFVFEGFLPRKGTERVTRLQEIAAERRTVVLYESARRLSGTLDDLVAVCGSDRRAVVARELTKLHEEMARGPLGELRDWAAGPVKGEVVVVVDGAPPPAVATDTELIAAIEAAVEAGSSRRDATADVAVVYGVPRRRVYDLAIAAQGDRSSD